MTAREIFGLAILTLPFLGLAFFAWCIRTGTFVQYGVRVPLLMAAFGFVTALSGVWLMTGSIGPHGCGR